MDYAVQLLAQHDIQNHLVRGLHADGADGAEVADGFFDVVFDDAVGGGDAGAAEGEDGGLDGAGDAGGDLHGAADLGAVADHAGNVADHVLDGGAHLLVGAALQVDDATGGAGGGDHAAAEGRQFAQIAFDMDGHEIAQDKRPGEGIVTDSGCGWT